ncbi:lipopolysaccharide biosynthesis protein [Muribaculum intestinale]|uniref:lipopolysaccharide biosynthesis protein n=1 Tax=Muribaculum intestinale TaxID=1796646 RepID=UPI0025A9FB01|nr:sugar transporter [Muribaculum intestinale]
MSESQSRTSKMLKNVKVNMVFYVVILIMSFFSRKIFLDCLGVDFIGLSGTLSNLFGFLNLAELGIGSAIAFLLYKPLFDGNQGEISDIISVMGYLYRCIGLFILFCALILSLFLPIIFPSSKTGFDYFLVYFAFYSTLISILIGYFINYKQNLLGADQKNYVITICFQGITVIKILIQMLIAWQTKSCYLWLIIELVFGVVYSIILNQVIRKSYPWLETSAKRGKTLFKEYPQVIKKTKQCFIHKLGGFVQYQTAPFLIYEFSSLTSVALYGNYSLIVLRITSLFTNMFAGTNASVGNLIAEGDKTLIINTYWEFMALRTFIASIVCVSTYVLISPFITLWLGSEYLLSQTVVILVLVNAYIRIVRTTNDDFACGFGMFWDVWSPIAEIVINLAVAIVCGYLWGLPGVLLGGVCSLLIVICAWKPYFLFHWGFKKSFLSFLSGMFLNHVAIAISILMLISVKSVIGLDPQSSWTNWLLYSAIVVLSYVPVLFVLFLLFSRGMRLFVRRLYRNYSRRIKIVGS